MAEGGNPQNVFNIHMEGGGTFVAGDHVRWDKIVYFEIFQHHVSLIFREKNEVNVIQAPRNNYGEFNLIWKEVLCEVKRNWYLFLEC